MTWITYLYNKREKKSKTIDRVTLKHGRMCKMWFCPKRRFVSRFVSDLGLQQISSHICYFSCPCSLDYRYGLSPQVGVIAHIKCESNINQNKSNETFFRSIWSWPFIYMFGVAIRRLTRVYNLPIISRLYVFDGYQVQMLQP